MKFYFQKNTDIYFLSIEGNFYSSKTTGKAKKEGVNVLKNAFPPPREIPKESVPLGIKKKFEKKISTSKATYSYIAEEVEVEMDKTIIIEGEFKLPGTDLIIESGDSIRVIEV